MVFVTRADQLLTESEVRFLTEHVLPNNPAKCFFVVNFADLVSSAEDRRDLEERAQTILQPLVGNVELHFVSSADALDGALDSDMDLLESSGIEVLKNRLMSFLTSERVPLNCSAGVDLGSV